MRILALETSTDACSVAVVNGDACAERHIIAPRQHTQLIFEYIEATMHEAGIGAADLDLLALGCGPGAFTGVRIGTSIAQGIALAQALPVAPVSSLAALAAGAARLTAATHVAAAQDARRGEIYFAAYRVDSGGAIEPVIEQMLVAPNQITLPSGPTWVGAGTAWTVYAETLPAVAVDVEIAAHAHPRARDVAALGARQFARGDVVDAAMALPNYLRGAID